jgi:methionine aminotransferase
MQFTSKLPEVGTTIFTVMSALANKHKAINLSQGFPNFPSSPMLNRLVFDYMDKGYNQYAPMAGVLPLREQLAQKVEKMYGIDIHPDTEITITAGATQAIFTAITAFVKAGDEVIILEPAYDSYKPAIEVNGGKAVIYEMQAPDYKVDWEAIQQLISPATRMIIINTPHNPTGTTLKAEDLNALATITRDTNILVISDEVYEHLIYDHQSHQSVLRYPELWQRSMATYSFGKTFHNTGWKVGYCLAPAPLMEEFRKVHQFNVFSVNTPVQYALAEYLTTPEHYLSLPGFYQEKRDFFLELMKDTPLRPLRCEGTYFYTFDYSAISDEADMAFAKRLTTDYGVAVIPVSAFYSKENPGKVIRFCFAKTNDTMIEAGKRLKKLSAIL